MSAPAPASAAAAASPSSPATHASSEDESVGEGAASAAGASPSKAARKRRKKNKAQKALPSGGAPAHGHSHSHSHGGGHSHSHGGAPCNGHGSEGSSAGAHSHINPEDMSEAVHFCDVCHHFNRYAQHSFARLERMEADFLTIPSVLQSLVPGHGARMGELRRAVRLNQAFLTEIVSHRYVFHSSEEIDYESVELKVQREHPIDEERMSKVRSTLRQCVRDWSVEGAAERRACYGPILDELERLYPERAARADVRVLIPGSGLGRLVWETAYRGFYAAGCAFLILNCCKAKDVFTIYPFVHESKNLYRPEDQLRAVRIPDVDPSSIPAGGQLSMAAGDWMDIFSDLPSEYIHGSFARMEAREKRRQQKYEQQRRAWDQARKEHAKVAAAAVAAGKPVPPAPQMADEELETIPDVQRGASSSSTGPLGEMELTPSNKGTWDVFASCYFIDCATNILECLRTISYLLKPGGYWINFGPLLYHFSEIPRETSVDLSWAELRAAAPAFGLKLVREQLEQPSAYTSDDRSMLRSQYYCVSCTWQKVGEDMTSRPEELRTNPPPAPQSVAWSTRLANADDTVTNIVVDAVTEGAESSTLTALLQSKAARRVRERVALPTGTLVDVYEMASAQLGSFLLQAVTSDLTVGKAQLEGVEMLALLRK